MDDVLDAHFDGAYTRKKGLRNRYEYAANWHCRDQHLLWSETVWITGGGNRQFLDGVLLRGAGVDPKLQVTNRIETQIEALQELRDELAASHNHRQTARSCKDPTIALLQAQSQVLQDICTGSPLEEIL